LRIGDLVSFKGQHYRLRGMSPRGVAPRTAWLEDLGTGAVTLVPLAEVKTVSEEEVEANDVRRTDP
jgi:hypothetical protein